MEIGIISIFPKMFKAICDYGIISRALKKKILVLKYWNPRDFAVNNYKIDDKPYGGGPGMLMLLRPLYYAIKQAKKILGKNTYVIYLTPKGNRLNYIKIKKIIKHKKIILVCGRYNGVDERIILKEVNLELSIGDFILSGGELAAMVFIDVVTRLLPNTLKNKESLNNSFSCKLLEHPQYSRPRNFKNMSVPSILLSGNHKKINLWKLKQSLGQTWLKRPDILKKIKLTKIQNILLNEFKNETYKKK